MTSMGAIVDCHTGPTVKDAFNVQPKHCDDEASPGVCGSNNHSANGRGSCAGYVPARDSEPTALHNTACQEQPEIVR